MTPPAPNPVARALAWARHRLDDWLAVRRDPALAPNAAFALLAIAGETARFFTPSDLPTDLPLDETLIRDAETLLAALCQHPRLEVWSQEAYTLDEAWQNNPNSDAEMELESASIRLFTDLDENDLALWSASRLPGADSRPWLTEWRHARDQALIAFSEHLGAFLPAAPVARQTLAACRPDLDETDWELFETTLKLDELVELDEEIADTAPAVPLSMDTVKLLQRRLAARLSIGPRPRRAPIGHPADVIPAPVALAADAGTPVQYRQLRWQSPDGALEARLRLPDRWIEPDAPLPLRIFAHFARPEVPLPTGQAIQLGSCLQTLNADAACAFTLRQLFEIRSDLVLTVDGTPWLAVPFPKDSV
jgi:hypothetical protein